MTLHQFLLARVAEDEAAARAQIGRTPSDSSSGELLITLLDQKLIFLDSQRRIVELHSPGVWACEECLTPNTETCATLRALAASYAAHPDYREEWKP